MWVVAEIGKQSGSCSKPHGENVRLEPSEKFMLSVEAIGRNVLKISVRWIAGIGDAGEGVGADAIDPDEGLLGISMVGISPSTANS